ncbi:Uncharacterised protein [Sebaldella termitidis]|uniref:Uncharacterized protein n=1 Tax=Sebaldella termitidis (strain ATCC 33386 / NCTC 11300) TaxID=526218 RepID=D1AHM8_SEBTE|nr:hypothetical protein [Sebaldella termitidis]ACZ08262.1 hypothetical protein Sterm_1399 [Sebaldella termitidis ATCC 33386]SUI23570.1 Uncharacterised protein [Sebaldella termitidis]
MFDVLIAFILLIAIVVSEILDHRANKRKRIEKDKKLKKAIQKIKRDHEFGEKYNIKVVY